MASSPTTTNDLAFEQPSTLPSPVDNVADGLENLRKYGFNIHRDYIDAATVNALRARVIEQAEMEREAGVAFLGGPGGTMEMIPCDQGVDSPHLFQLLEFLPNKGRIFIDLLMHQHSQEYARGLFEELPFRVWTTSAMISKRGVAQQPVHRDEGAIPPEMCVRPTLLNIFIILSEFNEEMGSTLMAPGSHLFPQPRYLRSTEGVKFFPVTAQPGDAVMWEGRTWHCGGEHRSDKTRMVVTQGYGLAGVTPQQIFTAALQDDVYDTLNEDELNMLGFRVEGAGYTNRIGPRYKEDKRRNTNKVTPFMPEMHRG